MITATVNGVTVIGETIDENLWSFNYKNGAPAFDLKKYVNEVGDVEYEYVWAEYPSDMQFVSENMWAGSKPSVQDIAEWIMNVYPN